MGGVPWEVSKRVYENHPARKYNLLGMVLNTLEIIDLNGGGRAKVAMLLVTREMFRKAGAEKDLADGFVNYARGIEGVEVGVLFREAGELMYKVSLRSKGDVDVAEVAQKFGGGGHRNAAGFMLKGSLEEIRKSVTEALKGAFARV